MSIEEKINALIAAFTFPIKEPIIVGSAGEQTNLNLLEDIFYNPENYTN